MDPNEALKLARALLSDMRAAPNEGRYAELADQFAEAFEALDGWLTRGGGLPTDWKIRCSECRLFPPACPHIKGRG